MTDTPELAPTVTQELLPCPNPWCEGSDPKVDECYNGDGWFVRCAFCNIVTPLFVTEAEAIAAWNQRTTADNALADEMSMDRRNAEIERAYNKLAEQPCTTQGAEDLEAGCCAPCRARTALAALRASPPRISTADVVEHRAREICERFGADPDEVTDPYGPVLRWHGPAYHINEAIEALRSPPPGETVPDPREQWEREHNEKIAAWLRWQAKQQDKYAEHYQAKGDAVAAGEHNFKARFYEDISDEIERRDYLNTPAQEPTNG